MNNEQLCGLTLSQLREGLADRAFTSLEVVRALKAAYQADLNADVPLHGFLEFFDSAEQEAKDADAEREAQGVQKHRPLLGLPIAVKDNISIKGKLCTCCSRALEGYRAPYNATVIERLKAAGAIILGRLNMDEFAMGSSTEYSCYGPSRNPVNREYTPGGSSGGSAAVVAAHQAPFALGTETGGSVRLPAAYCGVYGLKPTYGTLSRYGVTAFSSSLDQVGLFSRSVDDLGLILASVSGVDPYDRTSADTDFTALNSITSYTAADLKNMRIAVPKEFMQAEGLHPDVKAAAQKMLQRLTGLGCTVDEISIPILKASIPAYYIIVLSEAASNLSRIDGIRYGIRRDTGKGNDALYTNTRSEGFGVEVKRRILMGNYVLSKEFSGNCYPTSLNVRAKIEQEITAVFKQYDMIVCPTSPTPAFKLGDRVDDPIAMYLSDLFTAFVNIARVTSLSIPSGVSADGLPIGMQLCAGHFKEESVLRLAKTLAADTENR